ncbi:MAG TPA: DUF2497 domain-containing protein [Rhodospirillaceae bacterium]|nr:DUF2497 domain-containing protein [Rhodospirillaceae bacterium]
MEEILASIRRIIADENEPEAPAEETPDSAEEDVLELTQVVTDDGAVEEIKEPEPEPEPAPAPADDFDPVPVAAPEPEPEPEPKVEEEVLLSDDAASSAASSLSDLAKTVEVELKSVGSASPLGNGGRTLEDMVVELMKPLLKGWLDENLPSIVDRTVQKEVERIARRIQE